MTLALERQALVGELEPSLEELAEMANREAFLAESAINDALLHALACGRALIAVRERTRRRFTEWLQQNFKLAQTTAYRYMSIAENQDLVLAAGAANPNQAVALFSGRGRGSHGYPRWMREAARERREAGETPAEIADDLGVNVTSVYRWLNPNPKKDAERMRKRYAEKKALEEQQIRAAVKRAVKKAGQASAEAYSMVERFQDVLAQAEREVENVEARALFDEAGSYYRKMRDAIERAYTVSS